MTSQPSRKANQAASRDREADGKLNYAAHLIKRCETDLRRTLSQGERRDLLRDNTDWDAPFVVRCVAYLAEPVS